MFRNLLKYFIVQTILVSLIVAGACAGSEKYDPCSGAQGYSGVSKIKPSSSNVLKVRPYSGIVSSFSGISGLNPVKWGLNCCLPMPAKGQFVIGPRAFFARVQGDVRHMASLTGLDQAVVDFEKNLGLSNGGNVVWSISGHYQFLPRWGLRYSFTPLIVEGGGVSPQSFSFGNRTFMAGSNITSKWERYEHRAGLSFDVSRSPNSLISIYGEWMFIQDRLYVAENITAAGITWDNDKSLALLGLEFNKCLKNFRGRGTTLALSCKGGIAFLDDHVGYDAEAALSYLIPVKRGRFGFIKGGYRYAHLKKDRDNEMFATTLDGPFLEVGFLF
ncbi:hypothetical protein ACFL2Q_16225 [Thermodesulfobacteriota bacterium]